MSKSTQIIVCPFVDTALMDEISDSIKARTGMAPPSYQIFEGSIEMPCNRCGRAVWVSPGQQKVLSLGLEVICLDGALDVLNASGQEPGDVEVVITDRR